MVVTAARSMHPNVACLVCQEFSIPFIPLPLNVSVANSLQSDVSDCALNIGVGFALNVSASFLTCGLLPDWLLNTTLGLAHKNNDCNTDDPRYSPKFANLSFHVILPQGSLMCLCSQGSPDGHSLGHTECDVNVWVYDDAATNVSLCNRTSCLPLSQTVIPNMIATRTSGPVSWVCGSQAYTGLPRVSRSNATSPFLFTWHGCCTPALVLPHSTMYVHTRHSRRRRSASFYNGYTLADPWTSPSSAIGWSLFLGGGTTAALNKINGLAWQLLVLANDTEEALSLLNTELSAVRQAVLQNRMALDLILAKEGGVCKLPHNNMTVTVNVARKEHSVQVILLLFPFLCCARSAFAPGWILR
ncbi:hypothetical protein MHYP_G00274830 [Metynnis hypsauchen]